MKIHVLDNRRDVALPNHYLAIGHGGWTYGRYMVRAKTFTFLPQQAQCIRCRLKLVAQWADANGLAR